MPQFFIPMIAAILQGAVSGGISAGGATRQQNEANRLARLRREELQPTIDRLRGATDFFGVEEQLTRDFSRASDQMAAQAAQTGMTNAGSGGLDANRRDLLGSMLASLSEFKMQDQFNKEMMLAELLSDPGLYEGFRSDQSVGGQAMLGMLGGAFAGAGSILPAFLSTPEGIEVLKSLGSRSQATEPTGGIPAFGAGLPGLDVGNYQPMAQQPRTQRFGVNFPAFNMPQWSPMMMQPSGNTRTYAAGQPRLAQ
jgi:hypothetical protein